MKKLVLELSAIFLFILAPSLATAGISVSLKLDRKEALVADSIRMIVTISGTQEAPSEPILSGLEDFVVSKGGSSSRVEIVNGRFNAAVEYTYSIQAKKEGTFQIGPAQIQVEGKILKSNKETLTILKAPPSAADQAPLFLAANLSKAKAYVGEQVLYSLKLYRRIKISDISLELPETEHITLRRLGRPLQYQTQHSGSRYRVVEVRYGLIPTKEGNYGIQPFRMNLTAYEPKGRSPWGFFDDPFFDTPFFARGRPMTLASKPFELEVTPLPEDGRPTDFSGLVGSFKLESALSPPKIRVGESATLTIRLSGSGNITRIPGLKLPDINGAKVYADEPLLTMEPGSEEFRVSKVMRWMIVPESQGDYEIPPVPLSFFDPKTHQYRTIRTSPHSLVVLPRKGKMIIVEGKPSYVLRAEGRDGLWFACRTEKGAG